MANYDAFARSNYFRVKEAPAFEAWCKMHDLEFWTTHEEGVGDRDAISPNSLYGWPTYVEDEEDEDEEKEFDIVAELAVHLNTQDVAVLIEVGYEKLRYLTGKAIAVHSSGRSVIVDLDDIYNRAKEAFGDDLTITEARF